jgi:LAGLIDADG-like domain
MNVADVAWLAGIIDGEGCLTSKRNSQRGLSCVITIESVSEAMVQKVLQILRDCGIAFCTEAPLMRERSTRPSYRVRVQRKEAAFALCNLVLPYSVVKRPELLLIQQFLAKASPVTYYRATDEDLQIPSRLKELKRFA